MRTSLPGCFTTTLDRFLTSVIGYSVNVGDVAQEVRPLRLFLAEELMALTVLVLA